MKSLRQKIIVILFSVLYVALLGYMIYQSLSPAESSSEQSGMIAEFLSQFGIFSKMQKDGTLESFVRKFIGHYAEFGLLGAFGFIVFLNAFDSGFSLLYCCGAGLVSCVVTESMQNFATGRAASVFDVTLDFQGYLTAVSVLTIIVFLACLIKKQDLSNMIRQYFFCMPAYFIAIVPFSFYGGNEVGVFASFFTFLSAFLLCTVFAAIAFSIARKTPYNKKTKRRK